MADGQPRVRCRGKEILTEGRRNMGSTKAGKKTGAGVGVSATERAGQPWAGDSGNLASSPTCCVMLGKFLSYLEL